MHTTHKILFAASLSLSLGVLACTPAPLAPQSQATDTPVTQQPAAPTAKPHIQATASYSAEKQELRVAIQASFEPRGFRTQALDCDPISHYLVSLQGLGLPQDGLDPDAAGPVATEQLSVRDLGSRRVVNVADGSCSHGGSVAVFSNVPVGKGRVLKIEALRPDPGVDDLERIPGYQIMRAFHLEAGNNLSLTVDATTTPTARVLGRLSMSGDSQGKYLFSKLDLSQLENFVTAVLGGNDPALLNDQAIANDILSSASGVVADDLDVNSLLDESNTQYDYQNSDVSVTVTGGSGYPLNARVNDPSSASSVSVPNAGTAVTVSDVAPGEWELQILDSAGSNVLESRVITVDGSGTTVNSSIALAGGGAPSANFSLLNGPRGGVIQSLAYADGTAYLAGTDYGLYRTGNLNDLSGSPWTLSSDAAFLGKRVLSLYQSPVTPTTIYAGVNGKERFDASGTAEPSLYVSTDGGVNWTAASEAVTQNVDIHAFLQNGTHVYAATSDGVLELDTGIGTWTNVSSGLPGPGGSPPERGVADIVFDGSNYYIVLPDNSSGLTYLYESSSPGTGWSASTVQPNSTDEPISLVLDNINNLYLGTRSGDVLYNNGGAWVPRAQSNNPNAPVEAMFAYDNGGGIPPTNILAFTNGMHKGANQPGKSVQHLQNSSSTTPFDTDNWNDFADGTPANNLFSLSFVTAGFNASTGEGILTGTAGGGLYKSERPVTSLDWFPKNEGLNASHINDMVYDGSRYIYVATDGHGVHRYDTTGSNGWQPMLDTGGVSGLNGYERYPSQLAMDGSGNLYAVTPDKLMAMAAADLVGTIPGSWQDFDLGLPSGKVEDIAFAGSAMYTAVSGVGGDVYKRCKLGATTPNCNPSWTDVNVNGGGSINVFGLGTSSVEPNRLYASTAGHVRVATDADQASPAWSFVFTSSLSAKLSQIQVYQANAGDDPELFFLWQDGNPSNDDRIYYRVDDGNSTAPASQLALTGLGGPIHAIQVSPNNVDHLFVTRHNAGGVQLSTNATDTSTASFSPFTGGTTLPASNLIGMKSLHIYNDGTNDHLLAGSQGRGVYDTQF